MALRCVGRFGALIGGGVIALGSAMPVFGAQATLTGQNPNVPSPTDRDNASITVIGCLFLGPHGDYTLSKTVIASGSIMNAVAWKLEGNKELPGHVLEKVEVTGTMQRTPPDMLRAVGTAGSDRPTNRDGTVLYRLRAKTIKKVAGDCS